MPVQPSRVLVSCPLCQTSYGDGRIRLVSEQGEAKLYHCSCAQCGHAVLAIVLETSGWVSSVGVVTDLEADDVSHFQQSKTLSADECIKLYRHIEADGRAFCRALESSSSGRGQVA